MFENEDQFYGIDELGPIDEEIDDVTAGTDLLTDFKTTEFGTSESFPTEGTEGTEGTEWTEEGTVDPTTPYYMRFF